MVNITSGMKFAVDTLGINYSNVFTAFSFSSGLEPNTNILKSDYWATEASSGILNKTTFINNFSGSGFFDGNTFIQLNKNYQLNNSTILISYQKLRQGNEILLSSVTGNNFNNYSGFYIGINDANKLYLKYWNDIEGLFTFTYSKTLSDKNLIVINRTNSILKLGHFNNNTFQFENEDFLIFQNNFINNNNLYIGGTPTNFEWGAQNLSNFSGYIDRFYIFNNIPFIYSNGLAKGLYSEPKGYNGEFIETCYISGFLSGSGFSYTGITGVLNSGFRSGVINITGYKNVLSGYSYSGVTGSLQNIIGTYIDNCGVNINIFETVLLSGLISGEILSQVPLTGITFTSGAISINLTGTITGSQNVYVTGNICSTRFNVTGDLIYENDNKYLSSLSYKEISLLSHINSNNIEPVNNDIIEIYTEDYQPKTLEYNKDLTYDNLNSNYFYIDKEFKQNEVLMFGNGQAIIDSGYQLIPNGYEILRSPSLDYFITGTTIETNKFFGNKDYLFYDYFSGNFWASKQSGQIINIPINLSDNYWIFKNGQKLIEGINNDYILSPFLLKQSFPDGPGSNPYNRNINFNTAINGDASILFVGAHFDNENGNSAGKIEIWTGNKNDGWKFKQKILGSPTNYLGQDLKCSQNGNILISTTFFGNNYIFTGNLNSNYTLVNNTSILQNTILSPDGNIICWNFNNNVYISTLNNVGMTNVRTIITGEPNIILKAVGINNNGSLIVLQQYLGTGIYLYTGNSINGWKLKQSIMNQSGSYSSATLNSDGNILAVPTPKMPSFQNEHSIDIYTGNNETFWEKISTINNRLGPTVLLNKEGSLLFSIDSPNINSSTINIFSNNNYNYKLIQSEPIVDFNQFRNPSINNDGSVFMIGQIKNVDGTSKIDVYVGEPFKLKINESTIENQENYYIIKEIPDNFISYSGNIGSLRLTGVFNHGCSQVYYNGIKQKINNNYIENSNFDLLSGTFIEPSETNKLIYNNTDDFFV